MLSIDRIDVSKGIDVNKTSASKECNICLYWYLLSFSFKFHPNICNWCHDLLMTSVNLSDIAILNIKGSDYCSIIILISKNETINLMQNSDFTKKKQNSIKHEYLFSYTKMGKKILTFGDIKIEKKTNFTGIGLLFFYWV